jgi:hypothetical protein
MAASLPQLSGADRRNNRLDVRCRQRRRAVRQVHALQDREHYDGVDPARKQMAGDAG